MHFLKINKFLISLKMITKMSENFELVLHYLIREVTTHKENKLFEYDEIRY